LILRRWLVSCVAAVFEKDFRNRGVLVLQGEQSLGKTAWLERLVPKFSEFFTSSTNMDVRSRDDVKRVLGYWIVELGELEGVLRVDMPRLKAFLTLRKDEMRLPYGHAMTKYHRRTVFCASVNQFQFLSDPTGNSRWWSIPCVELDYRHEIDIQRLWAQVYRLYREGERWWLDRAEEDELTRSNGIFEQSDEIEDMIKAGFDWDHYEAETEAGMCDYLTATEALKLCKVEQPTKGQTMKAGEILRTMTGRRAERRTGGARCYLVPRKLSGGP
jgi:putative DNA primase/helicase